jgi:hypothetical protein
MNLSGSAGSVISLESIAGKLDLLDFSETGDDQGVREQLLEQAALLVSFDERLLAVPPTSEDELRSLLDECDSLDREPTHRPAYRLPIDLRRAALKRLGTRERMLAVREKLAWSREDRTEGMYESVLRGAPIDLMRLSRDELASLALVCEWVVDILPGLPDCTLLQARLSFEKTLSPLRQLIGKHFVGRQAELARLSDYVGLMPVDSVTRKGQRFLRSVWLTLNRRPPLMVHGPGGVGKSSLIAQFILTHLDSEGGAGLAFVHLDLDRALIDPRNTLTLLAEAAHQLSAQFPSRSDDLTRVARQLIDLQKGKDTLESSKSAFSGSEAVMLFSQTVEHLLGPDRPLLWVVDTFEEAQKLGDSVVKTLWQFFEELQTALPGLRLVVSGRVLPAGYAWDDMPLSEFDAESAQGYLRHRFALARLDPIPGTMQLLAIVSAVGRSPLALRMAVRVALNEGTAVFSSKELKGSVLWKMRAEQIQAQLFHRILEHIDGDEDIKRIASSGLALRRITPDVILNVLAQSCALSVKSPAGAQELFGKLALQVDIFEHDFGDGSLRHRTDVRRLMLRDLKQLYADKMAEIDRKAVRYYRSCDSDAARAEEIYHRLRLGQKSARVAARWRHGVEHYLQNAMEELGPPQQIFLANHLGISLSAGKRAEASLAEWELQTRRSVEDYLGSGDALAALEALEERTERLPGSPLWRLQAEALRLAGRTSRAGYVAQRGLDSSLNEGNLVDAVEMLLLLALIDEEQERFQGALDRLVQAIEISRRVNHPSGELRALIATARLDRKMASRRFAQDGHLDAIARLLSPALFRELSKRKAAYRELIAEIGHRDQEVLRRGMSYLGIDVATEQHMALLNGAVAAMLDEYPGAAGILNHVGVQSYGQAATLPRDVMGWIGARSSTEIGKAVAAALGQRSYSREVLYLLASVFREGVDRTVMRGQRSLL